MARQGSDVTLLMLLDDSRTCWGRTLPSHVEVAIFGVSPGEDLDGAAGRAAAVTGPPNRGGKGAEVIHSS